MTPTKYFSAKNQAAAFLILFVFVFQTVAQTATTTAPAIVSSVEKAIADPLSVKVETLEWVKQAMGIETHYAIIERREVSLG